MAPRPAAQLISGPFNLSSLLHNLPSSLSRYPGTTSKCSTCLFSTSSALQMKRKGVKKKNERKDPYRMAQALQRRNANLAKRKVLIEERAAALGDPVQSRPTPFLASLNLTQQDSNERLNYFLTPDVKDEQVKRSQWLTEPLGRREGVDTPAESEALKKKREEHSRLHANATHAIDNIVHLQNSSSKDRTRINIQRCIDTFGRHRTDEELPPKPASLGPSRSNLELDADQAPTPEQARRAELLAELSALPKRAGPDTGSSEVQIAILTTKINVMASNMSNKDKHNKRNLRLLVHKRAKLLKYLRRRERGGPRWQNLVDTLGINDAMWKGEISL